MPLINWTDDHNRRLAVAFALEGFHYRTISRYTQLSPGQISYALRRVAVKSRDYRNGLGPFAEDTIKRRLGKKGRPVDTLRIAKDLLSNSPPPR